VYIFYGSSEESRRGDCEVQEIAIYLIIIKSSFPPENEDYGDIFSLEEYMGIAENP
jgi:hypothetical protein